MRATFSSGAHAARERQRLLQQQRAEARKRRDGWVADQLRIDLGEDGARFVSVFGHYDTWTVRILQWLPHGVAAIVTHDFKPPKVGWNEDHEEAPLRAAVTRRFSRLAEGQRKLVAQWGEPRISTPAAIDLSAFRIERPLAAAMALAFGDRAGAILRRAIAENDESPWQTDPKAQEGMARAGMTEMEITVARGVVKGVFTVKAEDVELRWSKGGLNVVGVEMPETIMTALASGRRPLSTLLSHPLFDGDMTVTAVHPMRRKGRAGMALTMHDMEGPVPTGW